jgi:ribosomal protein S18 acetylase RimI-like enzyme
MRAVDPRRDLSGLADLIETAFADSLDSSGRRMVEEMRRFGRFGWLGWLAGHLVLPPAAFPEGFVWVEDGRLVGNASLMRVEGASDRWVLANVAVRPEHRRRGIARRLVAACIDLVDEKGAEELLLQVKADNQGAQELYRQFGFALSSTRATWRRSGRPSPDPGIEAVGARPRRPSEWMEHYELARRLAPEGLVWPHPLRASLFRSGSWLGGEVWRHWVWPEHGPMQAWLSARMDSDGARLYLVTPTGLAAAQQALLQQALRLAGSAGEAWLEVAGDPLDSRLREQGFRLEHRLAWMSRAGRRQIEIGR